MTTPCQVGVLWAIKVGPRARGPFHEIRPASELSTKSRLMSPNSKPLQLLPPPPIETSRQLLPLLSAGDMTWSLQVVLLLVTWSLPVTCSCLMSAMSMSQVTKLVSSCEEGICSRSVRLSRSSRLDMSEVDMEEGVVGCC